MTLAKILFSLSSLGFMVSVLYARDSYKMIKDIKKQNPS